MRGPTRSLSRLCGWPSRPRLHLPIHLVLALILAAPVAAAQDLSVRHPIAHIEARLLQEPLVILDMEQARPLIAGDRSAKVLLGGGEQGDEPIYAKWKPVGRGGQGFNNEPRYDIAAYRFQTLFLDEPDYVVPPVVLRSMSLEEYRTLRPASQATLNNTQAVLFALSYWVENVTNRDPWDQARFRDDPVYARYWGNVNLLTHLVDHKDENVGNLLISIDPQRPRIFAVDNDVAFASRVSDQGDAWRRLQVDRLPREAVERLRSVTREMLDEMLGVLAEFEIVDGQLVAVEPGPNMNAGRGVRSTRERAQFGLTSNEIRDLHRRIERLLADVDRGRIATF